MSPDPIALSCAAGLLCRSHSIRVSEPTYADKPPAVYAAGPQGQIPREWRQNTAPDWRVAEFAQCWGEGSFVGDYDGPDPLIVLKPVGVPVTVEQINEIGVVVQATEWAGPLDVSLDGFVDVLDYLQFINWFEAGDMRADWNQDSFLDPLDYNDFISAFEAPR